MKFLKRYCDNNVSQYCINRLALNLEFPLPTFNQAFKSMQ